MHSDEVRKKASRSPAQMNMMFLEKYKPKMKAYRGWKQGQAVWEECREIVQADKSQI